MDNAAAAEISILKSALATALERADRAEAEAAGAATVITTLKLEIAKLRRQIHGPRSERKGRLLDQLELALEELEARVTEDELAAEQSAPVSGPGSRAMRRWRRPWTTC